MKILVVMTIQSLVFVCIQCWREWGSPEPEHHQIPQGSQGTSTTQDHQKSPQTQGVYHIVSWEPEGRYRCTISMAIAPFWLPTDDTYPFSPYLFFSHPVIPQPEFHSPFLIPVSDTLCFFFSSSNCYFLHFFYFVHCKSSWRVRTVNTLHQLCSSGCRKWNLCKLARNTPNFMLFYFKLGALFSGLFFHSDFICEKHNFEVCTFKQ